MKNLTKITRRLMLAFMAFVISSTMFLSSPAVAATVTSRFTQNITDYNLATSPVKFVNLTPDNYETEVLKSDKPVFVALLPGLDSTKDEEELKKIKLVIDSRFSDENDVYDTAKAGKYKFVLGKWKDFAAKVEELEKKWDEDAEKNIHDNDEYYSNLLDDPNSLYYQITSLNYNKGENPVTQIVYKNGEIERIFTTGSHLSQRTENNTVFALFAINQLK